MTQFLKQNKTDVRLYSILFITIILLFLSHGLYKHYNYCKEAGKPNGRITKAVVTGYSTGKSAAVYHVKWYDSTGKEQHSKSTIYANLPQIGDTVEVKYYKEKPEIGYVYTYDNLEGGLKRIIFFIIFWFTIALILIITLRINRKKMH